MLVDCIVRFVSNVYSRLSKEKGFDSDVFSVLDIYFSFNFLFPLNLLLAYRPMPFMW